MEEISITGFSGAVSAKYRVDAKVLGEGHYGTVRKCQDKETGDWYVRSLATRVAHSRGTGRASTAL